jgi:hypothetical protein
MVAVVCIARPFRGATLATVKEQYYACVLPVKSLLWYIGKECLTWLSNKHYNTVLRNSNSYCMNYKGGAKVQAPSLDVTDYKPPPPKKQSRTKTITLKMDIDLLEDLHAVVRLWQELAKARGDDWERVNQSHVCRELLMSGVAGAFDTYGGKPVDEEGWSRVLRTISKKK